MKEESTVPRCIMAAAAAERPKLLYVIVQDELPEESENVDREPGQRRRPRSSRYTRVALQSTVQFMGCKPRHAFKISTRVFDVLRNEPPFRVVGPPSDPETSTAVRADANESTKLDLPLSSRKPPKPSQKRSMVLISREKFLDVVCEALAQYQYVGPNQRADLMLACRFRERKASVTVLLCGTSGCGKSTLSSLLASRLGITTVVSTDSIRHMMRGFADEKTSPLLWASTYHAGDYLDPVAVKEATMRRKATKNGSAQEPEETSESHMETTTADATAEGEQESVVSAKTMVIQGFKAQCEMVIDSLDRLITSWEAKNESVVIEGVHLSLNFVMGLMRKHPSIVPFMIYISNEEKHLERFAVRAKYMTLDPSKNKYAKYIRNIRTIQEYLCKRADKHLVPKINNTNVDKSVAGIHATIFSCFRRKEAGEPLYDPSTNTAKVVDQEYQNQYAASSLGSKCMFQLIQRKGSSHHLMALNVDGSVARTWPLDDGSRKLPLGSDEAEGGQVRRMEPVNLHFGNFGLSAFRETGETSSSSAGDGQSSKGDNHEYNSSRSSMASTSPRHAEVAEKEAVDETAAMFVSEEEPEEDNDAVDSDEESPEDGADNVPDSEIEGSVSESVRSDDDVEYISNFEDNDDWSEEQLERMEAQVFNNDLVVVTQQQQQQLPRSPSETAAPGAVKDDLLGSAGKTQVRGKMHSRTKSLPAFKLSHNHHHHRVAVPAPAPPAAESCS